MDTQDQFIRQALSISIGGERVRLDFNPSHNEQVESFKFTTAALINACEDLKDKNPRLAALAQTAYEEACMWAVKAATTGAK